MEESSHAELNGQHPPEGTGTWNTTPERKSVDVELSPLPKSLATTCEPTERTASRRKEKWDYFRTLSVCIASLFVVAIVGFCTFILVLWRQGSVRRATSSGASGKEHQV